jgi:hypothetical protein
MFPDEKHGRFKTREMKLKEYLIAQYPDKTITHGLAVQPEREITTEHLFFDTPRG